MTDNTKPEELRAAIAKELGYEAGDLPDAWVLDTIMALVAGFCREAREDELTKAHVAFAGSADIPMKWRLRFGDYYQQRIARLEVSTSVTGDSNSPEYRPGTQ